jgi:hypothetical protein
MIAAGLGLLVVGMRGTRVGQQPVCRACGFDLSASADGTATCSECGAGLKRPKAVRRGRRHKRPIVIVIGLLMMLAPAAVLGAVGYALITGVNLDIHKPLEVLEWELKRAGPARSRTIAEELLARLKKKGTPRRDYERIVELALAVQGDPTRPWSTEWGEVISEADMSSRLNKERSERFRKQAAVLDVKVRERVKVGDELPISVQLIDSRVGPLSDLMTVVSRAECWLDGKELKHAVAAERKASQRRMPGQVRYVAAFYHYGRGNRMSYGSGGLSLTLPDGVSPGRYVLKVKLSADTRSNRMAWTPAGPTASSDTILVEFSVPVEIVDRATVEMVAPDEATRQAIQLQLEPIRVMNGGLMFGMDGGNAATIQFNMADLPVGVDFDVKLRSGERTWDMGRLSSGTGCQGQELDYFYGFGGSDRMLWCSETLSVDKVDVILTPSAQAAARTVDLFRIYGEQVVYKDVEVSKPKDWR